MIVVVVLLFYHTGTLIPITFHTMRLIRTVFVVVTVITATIRSINILAFTK